MKQTYEKPTLTFVDTVVDQAVANTCWGGHDKEATWYYNISGNGYVSFQITGGSCTLNLAHIVYYDKKTGLTGVPSDDQLDELNTALKNSGGESGNPFKGESTDFPLTPNSSWS